MSPVQKFAKQSQLRFAETVTEVVQTVWIANGLRTFQRAGKVRSSRKQARAVLGFNPQQTGPWVVFESQTQLK